MKTRWILRDKDCPNVPCQRVSFLDTCGKGSEVLPQGQFKMLCY